MIKRELLSLSFLYTHSATATNYAIITSVLHGNLNFLLYISGVHSQADLHSLTRGYGGTRQVPGFAFTMPLVFGETRGLF